MSVRHGTGTQYDAHSTLKHAFVPVITKIVCVTTKSLQCHALPLHAVFCVVDLLSVVEPCVAKRGSRLQSQSEVRTCACFGSKKQGRRANAALRWLLRQILRRALGTWEEVGTFLELHWKEWEMLPDIEMLLGGSSGVFQSAVRASGTHTRSALRFNPSEMTVLRTSLWR